MSEPVTVLVVEDDDDLRFGLALRFRALGYRVVEAGDGYSAVSLAIREHPGVVLLDLGLPGVGGVSVLERFSRTASCSTTPVVVLTGRDHVSAAAEVEPFRVSAVLTKPADDLRLREALATAAAERELLTTQSPAASPPGTADERHASHGRVLVVEDDDDLRRGLVLRLESLGYDVVQAPDGYSAVSVAGHHLPDVVLLDLGLPGGDGVSVLQRFTQMLPLSGLPVVVLTGRDPELAAADVRPFHVHAVLAKPATTETLRETLASAMHQGPHATAEFAS